MTEAHRIWLPLTTPSQNQLRKWHFSKYGNFRDQCRALLAPVRSAPRGWYVSEKNGYCEVSGCQLQHYHTKGRNRFCRAHNNANPAPRKRKVTFTRHSSGTLDYGNMVGGMKPLLDALVLEGFLFDDSPAWLDDTYEQAKCRRGEGFVEIEIREVG